MPPRETMVLDTSLYPDPEVMTSELMKSVVVEDSFLSLSELKEAFRLVVGMDSVLTLSLPSDCLMTRDWASSLSRDSERY